MEKRRKGKGEEGGPYLIFFPPLPFRLSLVTTKAIFFFVFFARKKGRKKKRKPFDFPPVLLRRSAKFFPSLPSTQKNGLSGKKSNNGISGGRPTYYLRTAKSGPLIHCLHFWRPNGWRWYNKCRSRSRMTSNSFCLFTAAWKFPNGTWRKEPSCETTVHPSKMDFFFANPPFVLPSFWSRNCVKRTRLSAFFPAKRET